MCCKEQPSEYFGPSWSWVSVNCGVSFSDDEILSAYLAIASHSEIFLVLEGKCTTGVDAFGRVTDGFLRIDAMVASLRTSVPTSRVLG